MHVIFILITIVSLVGLVALALVEIEKWLINASNVAGQ